MFPESECFRRSEADGGGGGGGGEEDKAVGRVWEGLVRKACKRFPLVLEHRLKPI